MIVVLSGMLAAGLLLVLSPWLWPDGVQSAQAGDGPVRRLLDDAGYAHARVRTPVAVALAAGLVTSAAAWIAVPVPVLAGLAALSGSAAPFVWLRGRARRRRRARRALWPDVCDLLVASVRAGLALPDAVASLRSAAPAELRPAFALFAADLTASGHFGSSADRLKTVLADPVADRIIETLRMARHVGGTELVPVLRALAASVRADAALRAEVEARQSWVHGAAVLGVVAPWVILVLLAMRPEGLHAYRSPEGLMLVVAGAVVSAVAFRLMLWIGHLPEERRWFG